MQPYFLPYIGYFQLINSVDLFVTYDNIKYTKKGWINRNRMLVNGVDSVFSLPLRKDSDCLIVVERKLAAGFDRLKLLNQFKGAYARAPYYAEIIPLMEEILFFKDENLFRYVYNSIDRICNYLEIVTKIIVSSEVAINHDLKGQDKVLALCKALNAETYINPPGGLDLYSRETFMERGIKLQFLRPKPFEYEQFGAPFVPWLSIIDVMMFNPPEVIRTRLDTGYEVF